MGDSTSNLEKNEVRGSVQGSCLTALFQSKDRYGARWFEHLVVNGQYLRQDSQCVPQASVGLVIKK